MKLAILAILFSAFCYAQTPAPPPTPEDYAKQKKILEDWPNLARYHDANAKLPPPAADGNRVVFMGDSITDGWPRVAGEFFPGHDYIDRGISGQTTPQMVVRFWPDVIALHPKAVVILAGTNDLAGNTGPETLEAIEENFMAMADIAKQNGVRVILASILPAYDYKWRPGIFPSDNIATLNTWLRGYAAKHGFVYLDYYSAMVDSRRAMKAELTKDGVHPNKDGYAIMAPLAQKAIHDALLP
jgi:lysophospholipase L1-like esterase